MDKTTQDLARREQERYFGKYRGLVADNQDPEQRGRLRVRVPSVLGDQVTGWALPCFAVGGLAGQGLFAVPEVNAQLWIEFEEGDLQHPIWTGTFYQQTADVPGSPYGSQKSPQSYVLRTPGGHVLRFDQESGKERVVLEHASGAAAELGSDGSAELRSSGGESVTLDASSGAVKLSDRNGNSLSMAADGVKLKAMQIVLDAMTIQLGGPGGEPLVKGLTFLAAFASHMHTPPGAPPGAPPFTGPPIAPPPPPIITLNTTGR